VQVKDYYAELPIAIRVSGRYHDIGSFAADVANLSRIVTLHNLSITPQWPRDASGNLSMEATARTYRYLDATEIAEQRGRSRRAPRPRGPARNDAQAPALSGRRAVLPPRCCWPAAAPTTTSCSLDGAAAPRGQAQRHAAAAAQEVRPRALHSAQAVEPFSTRS
jgi:hypothetical protein